MKTKQTSPSRQQPHREARDKPQAPIELSPNASLKRTKAGVAKSRGHKGGNTKRKRGHVQLQQDLDNKIAAMEPRVAWLEQSALLGVAADPDHPSPNISTSPMISPKKRGRPRKLKKREKLYMDEFLDHDGGEEDNNQDRDEALKRHLRWVPEMEHRPHISRKPDNVPQGLWTAYSSLNEYMYRYSLTKEEVLAHPLMDDVWEFQIGGPQPAAPPGFQWNDEKTLVPTSEV
ncbi:hypothetical protein F4779DRAFT_291730 [Xylariaceae sp. FL0662B]|nr:hypothetical protein F4779DRAFT_291730 [Xylariaceae sp. FL0662B]